MKCGKTCLALAIVVTLALVAAFVAKPARINHEIKLFAYKVKNRLTPHRTVAEVRGDLYAAQPGTLAIGAGKNELIEFIDYNCGGCRRQSQVLEGLRDEGLRYRLIVRHNPIKGEKSEQAALAVIAAGRQGRAESLHAAFMAREEPLDRSAIDAVAAGLGIDTVRLAADMKNDEVTERLADDRSLAWQLRILGAPIFVFGDQIHKGLLSREQILALLDPDGEFTLRRR